MGFCDHGFGKSGPISDKFHILQFFERGTWRLGYPFGQVIGLISWFRPIRLGGFHQGRFLTFRDRFDFVFHRLFTW